MEIVSFFSSHVKYLLNRRTIYPQHHRSSLICNCVSNGWNFSDNDNDINSNSEKMSTKPKKNPANKLWRNFAKRSLFCRFIKKLLQLLDCDHENVCQFRGKCMLMIDLFCSLALVSLPISPLPRSFTRPSSIFFACAAQFSRSKYFWEFDSK